MSTTEKLIPLIDYVDSLNNKSLRSDLEDQNIYSK